MLKSSRPRYVGSSRRKLTCIQPSIAEISIGKGFMGLVACLQKNMPDFKWAENVPKWLGAEDNMLECQADRDDAAAEREEAAREQQARRLASEGDTTVGPSSQAAPHGLAGEVP